MHLISEVQGYRSLGILRPKGVMAYTDIELLVNWMLDHYNDHTRKFVVNLSRVTTEVDVALLFMRMADMALAANVEIGVCLPEDLDVSEFAAHLFSPRVGIFPDEGSAITAIG